LTKEQSYKTAENLLIRQIKQYAIDLEDAIAMVVYEDTGVKKLQWVAEDDYKTCGDCKELDGEIFDLDKAPDKLHHNCRCYLIPIVE
jgi:SPP1 gp7 family putative phage head morphogenesis protein